jgi:hypothetical protein
MGNGHAGDTPETLCGLMTLPWMKGLASSDGMISTK